MLVCVNVSKVSTISIVKVSIHFGTVGVSVVIALSDVFSYFCDSGFG